MKEKIKKHLCKHCSKKAEFYTQENNKTIYLCEEHSMKLLKEGKYNFIPRVKDIKT